MDDDKFALAEKIVKDIENIMTKNAELYSFEIVPVEANFQNKSPVLHVENCLGLESWSVKHVYLYCYREIMDKLLPKQRRKTLKLNTFTSDRLVRLLNVTLLLNPELSTLWNIRRELVVKLILEKNTELQFSKLVLSRKPKCNDAFAYRRWLLDLIFQDASNYNIENLVTEELELCHLASDKSPNNYHSWNHRMWLINKLKFYEKQLLFNLFDILCTEYDFSEKWTLKHVSDFSCYHYRQFCIKNIFTFNKESFKMFYNNVTNLHHKFIKFLIAYFPKDMTIEVSEENLDNYSEDNLVNLLLSTVSKNCNCISDNVLVCRKLELLFNELQINNEMLSFYKYHETLWYHRRFIIHEIIAIMFDHFGLVRQNGKLVTESCKVCQGDELLQKQAKIGKYDSERVYSSLLFVVLISHEKKFVQERRNDNDNYADRHEKYLKFVEGLNNFM